MKALLNQLKTAAQSQNQQRSCLLYWLRGAAVLLPIATIFGLSPAAQAGGIARNFDIRNQVDQQGSIRIVGNTTMTCSDTAGSLIGYLYYDYSIPPANFANPSCANARNRAGGTDPQGSPNNINDAQYMVYVDTDADGTTINSSASTFTLPTNASITFAGLYWSGNTGVTTTERFYGYSGDYDVYIPGGQAAPNASLRNQVKFKVDSGSYQTLTATQIDSDADGAAAGTGDIYQGFVEVTALVADQTGGSTRTYTVADIQSAQGQKGYGAWSLVVTYEDTTEPLRNLTVYDGFIRQQDGDGPTSTTISGFRTPLTAAINAEAGIVIYEGDLDIAGDQFLFNGTAISDALNPSTDFWNSNATQFGSNITGRTPSYTNLFGTDINLIEVSPFVTNGDTSATLGFTTTGDQYFPGVATFAIDIFRPELTRTFTKRAVDVNGGAFVPGDEIEYEISYTNTGNDGAAAVVVNDAIPSGTTFVDDSIQVIADPEAANIGAKTNIAGDDEGDYDSVNNQIVVRTGTGADATQGGLVDIGETVTIRFRVKIDASFVAPNVIANQATIDYEGQTTSDPYAGTSDDPDTPAENDSTTIAVSEAIADLTLVKRVTAINTTAITSVLDDPTNTHDDDPQWPAGYLQGSIDTSQAQPGDEIEYTIYFLANGNTGLSEVHLCDLIPTDTTYVAGSGAIALGTNPANSWTDDRDPDAGEYIAPSTAISALDVPGIGLCRTNRGTTQDFTVAENPNGAVWVEVDNALTPIPAGQVGYIRFRVRVNESTINN